MQIYTNDNKDRHIYGIHIHVDEQGFFHFHKFLTLILTEK